MRINHNIPSMVTQGALHQTNRRMAKNLERLSTGLRINRSSDDAAGLGVSENLRTQVRGTAQASKNSQDGIAALAIAEGAANEISAILQRMRELAIQSANDTLTSVERGYTDTEFQALDDEITRIANVTNYNDMNLLSGAGTNRFGDPRKRGLDGKRHEDLAREFLGATVLARCGRVLPEPIEILPAIASHRRPGILGMHVLGSHVLGPAGSNAAFRRLPWVGAGGRLRKHTE